MTDKRIAYWTDESYQEDSGQYKIIKIEENEPGYWDTGERRDTLEAAQRRVNELNEALGLHSGEPLDIAASSMAAHFAAKYPDGVVVDPPTDAAIESAREIVIRIPPEATDLEAEFVIEAVIGAARRARAVLTNATWNLEVGAAGGDAQGETGDEAAR